MTKIAIENATVVLTPTGAWSWASGRQLEIRVTGSDAPFTVNGEPVLLAENIVAAIEAGVPKEMYRHCDAATASGAIASVGVKVKENSLSQQMSAAGRKLVTSETRGTFDIQDLAPSMVYTTPDPLGRHSGSWLVKDPPQTICTEGAALPPFDGVVARSGDRDGPGADDEPEAAQDDSPANEGTDRSEDELRIWIKAFIPNELPANKKWSRRIPGQKDRWIFRGPKLLGPNVGFETDHRGFSNDPRAEAKVTTDFTLRFDGEKAEMSPPGSIAHQPGTSRRVDYETGEVQKQAKGEFSWGGRALGSPAVADGQVQIKGGMSIKNPLAYPDAAVTRLLLWASLPLFWVFWASALWHGDRAVAHLARKFAPYIDYSFDFTYAKDSRGLSYRFTAGQFPAFEAYASLNGSPTRELLTLMPESESPVTLYDLGYIAGRGRVISGTVFFK